MVSKNWIQYLWLMILMLLAKPKTYIWKTWSRTDIQLSQLNAISNIKGKERFIAHYTQQLLIESGICFYKLFNESIFR